MVQFEITTPFGKKMLGDDAPCFIVAEAGVNHNGSLNLAKELIDVAVNAGADAVKFQVLTARGLYVPDAGLAVTDTGSTVDAYKVWEDVEMPSSWIPELKLYCEQRKILFFASVFDENGVKVLDPHVNIYKIASSELTHLPLLKTVARTGKTIILSLGSATLEEVEEAVAAVTGEGNTKLVLMPCVQKYPTPLALANVSAVRTLKERYPTLIVGYSDHSLEPAVVPAAAVSFGAKVIEKHFTLSRGLDGIDHQMSLEPRELSTMVQSIRATELLLKRGLHLEISPELIGDGSFCITPENHQVRSFVRRKIFTTKPISRGQIFTEDNIAVLRPGNRETAGALDPREYEHILGRRAAADLPSHAVLTTGSADASPVGSPSVDPVPSEHNSPDQWSKFKTDLHLNGFDLRNFIKVSDQEKEMILNWRNHDSVRTWMLQDHLISPEEHFNFIRGLATKNNHFCWLVKKEDVPVGVVALHDVDFKNKHSYFGAYGNPHSRDIGQGFALFKIIISLAFDIFELHSLRGSTIGDNPVLYLHQKVGFKEVGRFKDYVSSKDGWKDVTFTELLNPRRV